MKIAYISESNIPSRAANSIHVMKMCQAFAKNGHRVVLFAPLRNYGKLNEDNADIYDYYGVEKSFNISRVKVPLVKGIGFIYYGLLSAFKSKSLAVDLVYGRSILGCLLSAFINLPVCYEIHQPPSKIAVKILLRLLLANKSLRMVIVISEPLKRHITENYDINAGKVLVLPDAADPIDSPRVVNDIASKKPEVMKVGYVGHLYDGRGIELIAKMALSIKDIDFHLVGGLDEDIEKWKAKFGNINNLVFHGFVAPGTVSAYLNSFDVLLAPYQKEVSVYGGGKTNTAEWMSPLKIFEYMSAGKPILCSDLPVLREVLEDGKTAVMLPPDKANLWISSLRKIREDICYYNIIGENAKREFLQKYTWEARAFRLMGLLNKE